MEFYTHALHRQMEVRSSPITNLEPLKYTMDSRRHRRMFHQYFQPRKLSEYYPSQSKMTVGLLDQLSRSPDNFASHIRQ